MISKIRKKLQGINILKTLYVNLAYFPFIQAIKFPILCYGKVYIRNAQKGRICVNSNSIKPAMLNIGTPVLGFLPKKEPTIFDIKGKLELHGKVTLGKGCAIEVCANGTLSFGDNTMITGKTTILCTQQINIGRQCMISWDNLIMDTDWHNVVSKNTGKVFPKQKPIIIGDHVWIGCRCTILKGTDIGNDSIVASNSKLTKAIEGNNILIGSNKILKEDVTW